MKNIILLQKKLGQSPLEAIEEFRKLSPKYQTTKLAYAGRLDPMAEGLLLILTGDECKNRVYYQKLPKAYEFEILLGISTDSYDILGFVYPGSTQLCLNNYRINPGSTWHELKKLCQSYVGKQYQSYPPYSAARVKGKPLYYWAREGKLNAITVPAKEIEIYDFKLRSEHVISSIQLHQTITDRIFKVSGNFRQEDILKSWNLYFKESKIQKYLIYKFHISCSSGTYVRSIAHEIGERLGTGALAFSIKRTQIGEFNLVE